MRSSLKERIIWALVAGGFIFYALCVNNTRISYREDWLSFSLIMGVTWGVGVFLARTLYDKEEILWKVIIIEVFINVLVAIVLSFILGVVCNLENWEALVINIAIIFGSSMLIHNGWISN